MNNHCGKYFTNASPDMYITNIFQFLVILKQNFTIFQKQKPQVANNVPKQTRSHNLYSKKCNILPLCKMFDQMHQQVLKQKSFQISRDFYTVFNYFAKNSNSDWVHNLYRKLSDELSMNKILDQMDQ